MTVIQIIQTSIIIVAVILVSVFIILCKKKEMSVYISVMTSLIAISVAFTAVFAIEFLERPFFRVKGNANISIPVFSEFTDPGAEAIFRNKNYSDKIIYTGSVNTNVLGEYKINYEFSMRGQNYSAQRNVLVVDDIAPNLELIGNTELIISSFDFYTESGFTANDNYDGDLTGSVIVNKEKLLNGNYKITYTVSDSSGNCVTATRNIIVKDIIKPEFSSSVGQVVGIVVNSEFAMPNVTASDDLDGDITSLIKTEGSVDSTKIGAYSVKYTVSDNAGNTNQMYIQFNVYEPDDVNINPIYLTFDDGPSPVTNTVLDILKSNNIKATFFILDYSADELPIIKRMISEGHTIGIHGFSHDYSAIYKSEQAFLNNVNSLAEKLKNDTGYIATIFRFPGGSSNSISKKYCTGVVTAAAHTLLNSGWRYFDWNVDSGDADGTGMPAYYIINRVKQGLKKGRTNVVLMHDFDNKITTAQALQEIINYAKNQGYTFNSINEKTNDVKHTIAN